MAVKETAPRSRRINHPSLEERLDQGKTAQDRTPPFSHAGWSPAADRPDPVGPLEEQDRYADQNEQDYEEFVKAVRSGRLEAVEGV